MRSCTLQEQRILGYCKELSKLQELLPHISSSNRHRIVIVNAIIHDFSSEGTSTDLPHNATPVSTTTHGDIIHADAFHHLISFRHPPTPTPTNIFFIHALMYTTRATHPGLLQRPNEAPRAPPTHLLVEHVVCIRRIPPSTMPTCHR